MTTPLGDAQLWQEEVGGATRYYLIPDAAELAEGACEIRNRTGSVRVVSREAIVPFEVSEPQAIQWAKHHVGPALDKLRSTLDDTLAEWRARLDQSRSTPVSPDTTVTPNAIPALLDLLRSLPRIVGQSISGDEVRLDTARQSLAGLQQQLASGGIELDERFTGFADRLAELRRHAEAQGSDAAPRASTSSQDADERPGADPDPSNPGPSR
jgi:hypothetical protein